jgi:hemerythrin-like domain-containing protein
MKAVESLIREHQLIARVVDALETYAHQLKQGHAPDAGDLAKFAGVFTDLGERIHHEKEENILLPVLVRHGVDWNQGTLPAVRREHRQEAYLIDVLRQAGERAGSWDYEDWRRIAAGAQALVDFQRSHHALESVELFPLTSSRLEASAIAALQQAIEKFDAEHEALRTEAWSRALALADRYAPTGTSGLDPSQGQLSGGKAGGPGECSFCAPAPAGARTA